MIHIEAIRDRPSAPRLEQLAGVFERFDIVPYIPPCDGEGRVIPGPDPDPCYDGVSRFVWCNEGDGKRITLAINLADDAKAPELIRELRMCGFVANATGTTPADPWDVR